MTTLIEQAFTAASALPQTEQDEIPMISSEDLKPEKRLADPY